MIVDQDERSLLGMQWLTSNFFLFSQILQGQPTVLFACPSAIFFGFYQDNSLALLSSLIEVTLLY